MAWYWWLLFLAIGLIVGIVWGIVRPGKSRFERRLDRQRRKREREEASRPPRCWYQPCGNPPTVDYSGPAVDYRAVRVCADCAVILHEYDR